MQEQAPRKRGYESAQVTRLGDTCPKMWCVGYCSKAYCPYIYCGAGYFEDLAFPNQGRGRLHHEVDTP